MNFAQIEEKKRQGLTEHWTIYDTLEKQYVHNGNFIQSRFMTLSAAEEKRDKLLDSGMYPDRPATVYQIIHKLGIYVLDIS